MKPLITRKKSLLALCLPAGLALLGGCSSLPHAEEFRLAKHHFVYESDVADEYRVYDQIDQPFYGDCEDFAFTLQRQIGGDVRVFVGLKGEFAFQKHAVLVKDGVVYDNTKRTPVLKDQYRGAWGWVLNY